MPYQEQPHASLLLNLFRHPRKLAPRSDSGGQRGGETSGLLGAVSDEVAAFVFRVACDGNTPSFPVFKLPCAGGGGGSSCMGPSAHSRTRATDAPYIHFEDTN